MVDTKPATVESSETSKMETTDFKTAEVKTLDQKMTLVSLEELEFEEPIAAPASLRRPIAVRPMVLMGTGPTNLSKRVMEALCKPVMGLHANEFIQVI